MTNRMTGLAAAALLTLLAGCGADDTGADDASTAPTSSAIASESASEPAGASTPATESSAPSSAAPAAAVTITIEGFEYTDPGPVAPGAEITVENLDQAAHTVTADGEGSFDVTIDPGETATFTAPDAPGEYPYLCTFHPAMTGTLVVA